LVTFKIDKLIVFFILFLEVNLIKKNIFFILNKQIKIFKNIIYTYLFIQSLSLRFAELAINSQS
jgi:hypothetical protein